MVKYVKSNNYQASVETGKNLHLFISRCEFKNCEVESLEHIFLSTVSEIENHESRIKFCRYITECFKMEEGFDEQRFLKNLTEQEHIVPQSRLLLQPKDTKDLI